MKLWVAVLALALTSGAQAQVFKCIENGRAVLSDKPCTPDLKPSSVRLNDDDDAAIHAVWNSFISALKAGNGSLALEHYSPTLRDQAKPVVDGLAALSAGINESIRQIQKIKRTEEEAYFAYTYVAFGKELLGELRLRKENGRWYIHEF